MKIKNQSLTRVFSIVIAIFAVILIACAIFGFFSARDEKKEDVRVANLLSSRCEEYDEITRRLSQGESLDKVNDELAALQKQYDRNKSAHQLALSTYTATKGALEDGKKQMAAATGGMSGIDIGSMLGGGFDLEGMLAQMEAMATDIALNAWANESLALQNSFDLLLAADFDAPLDLSRIEAGDDIMDILDDVVDAMYDSGFEINEEIQRLVNSIGHEFDAASAKTEIYATSALAGSFDLKGVMNGLNAMVSGLSQLEAAKTMMQQMELQVIKDSVNLSVSRSDLQKQEDEISALKAKADNIRADTRRQSTLKAIFVSNENIKKNYDRSGDVLSAAQKELERSEKQYKHDYFVRCVINVLMLAAGLFGLLMLPGAFEKTDKYILLILPIIMYTLLAASAETVNLLFDGENQYLALFAAIFGVVAFMIAAPKEHLPEED